MPSLYRRLDRVRALPASLGEAALEATLPHASPEERDAIVAELLESTSRHRVSGLEAVLRHWGLLSDEARRAAMVVGVDHLDALITRAVGQGVPSARRASGCLLARLIDDLSLFAPGELAVLAHASAELARDADPAVAREAMGALAAVAREIDADDPDLRDVVDRALVEAGDSWAEHRSEEMLEAIALRAHRAGPLLRAWLARADHPTHMPLRSAARRLRPDDLAPRLVRWLSIPALAPVATHRLAGQPTERERARALADSHLLLAPGRRAALARMGRCDGLLGATPSEPESSAQRIGVVRWCAHARVNAARRRSRLASMLGTGDASAQWAALRAMDWRSTSQEDTSVLLDFALAADARVAAVAARVFSMTHSPLRWRACRASVAALLRSPHASVRRAVGESRRWRDPLPEPGDVWACAVGARARLASDRTGFVDELRKLVTHGSTEQRLACMALAARLDLVPEIEDELVRATCGAEPRLAAKAIALLARATSPAARAAVESALRAEDGRVRATAVEVVAGWRDRDAALAAFVGDETPRVRANAIVHFLSMARTERSASIAITEMLSDERAGHRLSGLWAAEVGRRTDLADRARDLAMHDEDGAVRRRAMRCARALTALTRRSWERYPTPVKAAGG